MSKPKRSGEKKTARGRKSKKSKSQLATSHKKTKAKKKTQSRKGKALRGVERETGPRTWLSPIREATYTRLLPRDQVRATLHSESFGVAPLAPAGMPLFSSILQPAKNKKGENVLASLSQNHWVDLLEERQRRICARASVPPPSVSPLPGPAIPGQKNWAPLGPSVVINGQAHGLPPVAGRISGIAVVPGGQILYAASANGGVFRSDDGGVSWHSLMDAFDLDPTHFASTSLACGAIAIDMDDPNRVYVGTGEGATHAIFGSRITNALPAYRGIGPIRTNDGGKTWVSEPTAPGSPTLAGKAFYALAVDPTNRENVIGATSEGLYQRQQTVAGTSDWVHHRPGVHSSVVVASANGMTRFFAAEWGQGVFHSTNGSQWFSLSNGFPTTNISRIALGVQANDPNRLYALVVNSKGALRGVYRLDGIGGSWKRISNPPDVLPADSSGGSQGEYDLAIAIDPEDPNLIFLGGSYFSDQQYWPASIWQCRVKPSGSGFRMTGVSIGIHAHADVHVLTHTPDDPDALWVGCDGGIFLNRDPRGSGSFTARNDQLACLCANFFEQHPTDPNILFCGFQDNGTARTSGGPIWKHVNWGDGGYCLMNWADPQQVLVFANGSIYRATDGGEDHDSWTRKSFPWSMMTEPIVGPPYNPSKPAEAKVVALGEGSQVHISKDFGATWPKKVSIPTTGGIFSMVFASVSRIFVGTTDGEVFRLDLSGNVWKVIRLDNVQAGPLGLQGLVADIAINWADTLLNSIYIVFGGTGDYRHVWHFDGTKWEARSGPAGGVANNLLDVEHNAIVVDPKLPRNVYVGADIGVWHSSDQGKSWEPMPNGLPDAPVFDLQIHPIRRLLRASTHGRGLYEFQLGVPPSP